MLCIVCSRPLTIPIYRDENNICKSCASQIKLKDNSIKDNCTDIDQLECVQRKLLHDLNLEDDSDYEAELNYLREAEKSFVLIKDKNVQSLHCADDFKKFPYEELKKEGVPICSNIVKKNIEPADVQESCPKCDDDFMKSDKKLPQLLLSKQQIKEKTNRRVAINSSESFSIVSVKEPDESSNKLLDGTFSIACRAVYRPTYKHQEPDPQFEKIESVDFKQNVTSNSEMLPMIGNKNPFICPVTFCKNIIPVSDLIKHFKLNHIRVPIISVNPGAMQNIFWEAKVDRFGITQCLMLLLSAGKGKEPGYGPFRNCLPVAIMTTKVKFSDLAETECDYEDDRHFYMIWLTAMSSSVEPVYYTITAWNDGADGARVHIVNSSQSYSIRADQNPKIVYGRGMVMILTSEQVNRLSNNSQDMIKLQVVVH